MKSHRTDLFKEALNSKGAGYFIYHYKNPPEALLRADADVLLFEILNSMEEARLGLEAIAQLGVSDVSSFVSFEGSIRKDRLKSQSHLAAQLCEIVWYYINQKGLPVKTIAWNCASREDILVIFEVLKETSMLDMLRDEWVVSQICMSAKFTTRALTSRISMQRRSWIRRLALRAPNPESRGAMTSPPILKASPEASAAACSSIV